jgi:hypothetical protein
MSLYRTSRTNFNKYIPDGLGRDKYISYNNGGHWQSTQYSISPKESFEYSKYNNFHSLFHLAAPFKYRSDGSGRDSYILFDNGLSRQQKALKSFHLTDFLRTETFSGKNSGKNIFLSQEEIRENKIRRLKEKRMIRRLYTKPLEKILMKRNNESKEKEKGKDEMPKLELRTLSYDFGLFNKNLDKKEIIENNNDIDNAMIKSKKVEKYELQDEKPKKKNNIILHKRIKSNFGFIINNEFRNRFKLNYDGYKDKFYSKENNKNGFRQKLKLNKLEINS